jgi:hypothetical protein
MTDNSCYIEFDPFGLSVMDLATRKEIIRCNSSGRLHSFHVPPRVLLAATTPSTLWHRRLGHLGVEALSHLVPCNKRELETLCHACQFGRHVRQPFATSNSRAIKNFDLIHYDLWTSPVSSILVTNIISSFLMTAHILHGLFPFG